MTIQIIMPASDLNSRYMDKGRDMDIEQKLRMHHAQTLWMYWVLGALGFWLLMMPATFSYDKGVTMVNETRSLWLSLAERVSACEWSDRISGLALIVFGLRGIRPGRPVSLWICCLVGVWLNVAPLLFLAPGNWGLLTRYGTRFLASRRSAS